MRLAIFGLGQVGAVSAACLCKLGHDVLGLDVDREKTRRVNAGESPIAEASVGGLVAEAVRAGRLRAASDAARAVAWAEASLVCVDAPSHESGSQDTSQVLEVIQTIGEALRDRAARHTVIVRSTLLPGTTLGLLAPALERASGRRCGRDIGLAYCPEFLRAGSAVRDFMRPPYTIIGGSDAESVATAEDVYRGVKAPVHVVPVPDAEMLKYASNAFHALKVTFANEVGTLSKRADADGYNVLRLLAQDTKLNLSSAYLEPGFAYGGPCLPKDLRALLCAARQRDLDLPLLEGIEESNAMQIQRASELVLSQPGRRIGILGLTFKAGTEDLRESPVVPLVEALLRNGGHPRVYDPNVNVARVSRTHHRPTRSVLARFSELMVSDAQEIVDHADVLVIGNRDPRFADLLAKPPKGIVVDLVGLFVRRDDWRQQMAGRYHCLCG